MTDLNIRDQLYKEKIEKLEEDLMPFGFIDAGSDDIEIDSEGNVEKYWWWWLLFVISILLNTKTKRRIVYGIPS